MVLFHIGEINAKPDQGKNRAVHPNVFVSQCILIIISTKADFLYNKNTILYEDLLETPFPEVKDLYLHKVKIAVVYVY